MVDQEEVVQIPAARTCAAAGSPNTVMDQNVTSGEFGRPTSTERAFYVKLACHAVTGCWPTP
jgi:hypothetical protein